MEWKCMLTDKPEIGKTYVVLNNQGTYSVKRYVRGYQMDYNQITEDLRFKPTYSSGEIVEGFITIGGWYGRKINDPLFFMELPPCPELSTEERTIWQIRSLEKRLTVLEAKVKEKQK